MTDAVKVLTDDEVQRVWANNNIRELIISPEIDALCATVRALRMQVAQSEQAFELDAALKLSEVGNLNALQIVKKMAQPHETNTALREQLAQAHSDNERLALVIQNIEEREAAVCPEDVGFDEYIRTLKRKLETRPRAGYPWTGNEP